jgi:transposase-like protein
VLPFSIIIYSEARRRIDGFRTQWECAYPGAFACLVEDFESLTVHLRFPKEHWKRCRHTNLILVNRPMEAQLAKAA